MAVDLEPKDEVEQAADDARGPGGHRGWSRGKVAGLALAVVAVGVMLLFLTRPGDAPPAATVPPAERGPDGYETYVDIEAGFSLERPENWIPISRPQGNLRVVLTAGGQSSVSVGYDADYTTEPITDVEDLAALQPVTDRLGPDGAQVVQRQALLVNGMPTIFYLSRFDDQAIGAKTANARYLIFQGQDMYTLLFQAAPETDFDRLAPEFDKVLASFRGDPDYVAPEPDPEATPPTSAGS